MTRRTTARKRSATSTCGERRLTAANGLDELLEAAGLLDSLGVELARLTDAALGCHLLLGQVLGAVLELGLG